MLEVVAHVISAKGAHGHWVAPHFAELAEMCGRAFRGHRRPEEHAMLPIERLVDQRGQMSAAAAENDRGNRHSVMMLEAVRV